MSVSGSSRRCGRKRYHKTSSDHEEIYGSDVGIPVQLERCGEKQALERSRHKKTGIKKAGIKKRRLQKGRNKCFILM